MVLVVFAHENESFDNSGLQHEMTIAAWFTARFDYDELFPVIVRQVSNHIGDQACKSAVEDCWGKMAGHI